MFLLWFPFLFIIPWFIFWAARPAGYWSHRNAYYNGFYARPQGQDALEIARLRLARGEITVAEFDEIKRTLG